MAKTKHVVTIWLGCLLTAILLVGCGKPSNQLDRDWTPPVAISSSIAGLGGAARLHKVQDTLIGVQVLHGGSAQLFILNRANGAWSTTQFPGVPDGGWLHLWGAAAIDHQNGRVVLPGGYAENDQLVMKAFLGTISQNGSLSDITERRWLTDKKTLLGETGSDVSMTFPGKREGVGLGLGILSGSEAYIPFSLEAAEITQRGQTHVVGAGGPFASGVFHSSDAGKTWRMEKISERRGLGLALCRTTKHVYYFAGIYPLWFSRKPVSDEKWEESQAITETFARGGGHFGVAGAGNTAHICWMDRRHDKWRFNLTGPRIENCDIYYRRRKDSDADWSKEVHLSKGLLYCYAPTIAAEGDNVVVVWAGIRDAGKRHSDMGPNDIYYVTSKDAGKTWTSPLRVTDGAKDGITAGMPQVALLKGVIHLLYIQGARQPATELSPGLTKLGMEPWPIYHTQRPFPK